MLNRCLINLTLDNIIMCDSFNHENSLIRVLTKGSDSDLVNCVDQWTLIRTVDGRLAIWRQPLNLGNIPAVAITVSSEIIIQYVI